MTDKQKPVEQFRLGRVLASVWEREGQNGAFYDVSIQRLYKDGDDWKYAKSFNRDDLPLVAKVADQAHTWIFEQGQEESDQGVA